MELIARFGRWGDLPAQDARDRVTAAASRRSEATIKKGDTLDATLGELRQSTSELRRSAVRAGVRLSK